MVSRAYVLLSGGIDSTTCLYLAKRQFNEVYGISVNYGQRHFKELEHAYDSCRKLGIPWQEIDLTGVVPKTMLTDPDKAIPAISYSDIKGVSPTYVPFRNGLLLSAVTSHVAGARDAWIEKHASKQYGPDEKVPEWGIYFGAHAEDAQNWAYPDCTPEFIGAMANAIYVGSYAGIRLHTPLEWLDKPQIIMLGETLGVDWRLTWSCYAGGTRHCGSCPTCRARREGFIKAGVDDPTEYTAAAVPA